jgi:hypothetical protein
LALSEVSRGEFDDMKTTMAELIKSIRELRELINSDRIVLAEFKGSINAYRITVPALTLLVGVLAGLLAGHVVL